jgi:hypothetical protein
LNELSLPNNMDLHFFNATALFPDSSGQQLEILTLNKCGLTGIGGGSGTNFHGLLALKKLYLVGNHFGNGIAEDAFHGLASLGLLQLGGPLSLSPGLLSLPAGVFSGKEGHAG